MTGSDATAATRGVLFFDVNETLLATADLKTYLAQRLDNRMDIAEGWFTALLHHSLVESVTGSWHSFGEIAEAVLQMTAARYGIALREASTSVAQALAAMPAYPDVAEGLASLRQQGFTLVALTNSSADLAEEQLSSTGLRPFFQQVLSVEQLRLYKPDLRVYQWAMETLGRPAAHCMMVAAHGWDVGGAKRAGMHTAFIARKGQALYPLAPTPDYCVNDLRELATAVRPLC